MNKHKLTINGVTYVPETTEPAKRERQTFYVHEDTRIVSNIKSWGSITCTELFDGEIIISKEDFERLVKNAVRDFDKSLSVKQFMFLFIEELFK